jgi:hypothetical protein
MFRMLSPLVLGILLLTGCGAVARSTSTTTVATATAEAASSTPSPAATSTSAAASTSAPASPTPTAAAPVATPAPPTPLVVYRTASGAIGAVDGAGQATWAFRPEDLKLGPQPTLATAGPDLLAWGGGKVDLISGQGLVVGQGTYNAQTASGQDYTQLYPATSGRRWAWMAHAQQQPSGPSGTTSGEIWVAGIAEAPHRVFSWSRPFDQSTPGADDVIYLWSDQGIVVAVLPQVCDLYPHETSTFVLDADTGATRPLAGADRHIDDVHAGIALGITSDPQSGVSSVMLSGSHVLTATMTLANGYISQAGISPDGARFFATLFTHTGCGGEVHALTVSESVTGTGRSEIRGFYARGWYDDTHLVGQNVCEGLQGGVPAPGARTCGYTGMFDPALRVVDLNGAGQQVASGTYIGVLRPTG